MKTTSNTIELNGKLYDAKSGKQLAPAGALSSKPVIASNKTKQHHGSIDGISKRKPVALHAENPRTKNTVHRKAEKSTTLMRSAVKKPSTAKAKTSQPTIRKHAPSVHVEIDSKLAKRASEIPRSPLVSKFNILKSRTSSSTTGVMTPKPAPKDPPKLSIKNDHKPEAISSSAQKKAFLSALDSANSHKQPKPKKTTKRQRIARKLKISNRMVNLGALGVAILLLGSFVAYQNIPNLSMRVAMARAGVNGTLPNYQPSGFGLAGPVHYQDGQIVANYSSHSDKRQFSINQTATQWNSEALLANFITMNNKTYRTYQNNGKTIYLYDDDSATWVDGGVWYRIEGNSALSNDQLLRMAASM